MDKQQKVALTAVLDARVATGETFGFSSLLFTAREAGFDPQWSQIDAYLQRRRKKGEITYTRVGNECVWRLVRDWSKPTLWMDRFTDSLTLLCKEAPPRAMCEAWNAHGSEDLHAWVSARAPAWAQAIVVIDAAEIMADHPTEGVDHGTRPRRTF